MTSTHEWGEFFPTTMSDFGYNETVAQDYFPMTKDEATQRNYSWKDDDEVSAYQGSYHAPLPISQYNESKTDQEAVKKNIEDCTTQVHLCQKSGKPFKVIPKELAFYIENALPIPSLGPDARHEVRMRSRNRRMIHSDTCDEC